MHDPLLKPDQFALETSELLLVSLAAKLLDHLLILVRLSRVAHLSPLSTDTQMSRASSIR